MAKNLFFKNLSISIYAYSKIYTFKVLDSFSTQNKFIIILWWDIIEFFTQYHLYFSVAQRI